MHATKGRGIALVVLCSICLIAGISFLGVGFGARSIIPSSVDDDVNIAITSSAALIFFVLLSLPLIIPNIIGIIAGVKTHIKGYVIILVLQHIAFLVLVILCLIWLAGVSIFFGVCTGGVSFVRNNPDGLQTIYNGRYSPFNNNDDDLPGSDDLPDLPEGGEPLRRSASTLFPPTDLDALNALYSVLVVITAFSFAMWTLQLAASIICCASLCASSHNSGFQPSSTTVQTGYYPVNPNGYDAPVPQNISHTPGYNSKH